MERERHLKKSERERERLEERRERKRETRRKERECEHRQFSSSVLVMLYCVKCKPSVRFLLN